MLFWPWDFHLFTFMFVLTEYIGSPIFNIIHPKQVHIKLCVNGIPEKKWEQNIRKIQYILKQHITCINCSFTKVVTGTVTCMGREALPYPTLAVWLLKGPHTAFIIGYPGWNSLKAMCPSYTLTTSIFSHRRKMLMA